MALTVIIAYDVSDDRRRSRLAALIQAYGDRIQFSVFLCRVEPDELGELLRRSQTIIDPTTDSIYSFRQCGGCWENVTTIGQAHPPEKVLYWAVW